MRQTFWNLKNLFKERKSCIMRDNWVSATVERLERASWRRWMRTWPWITNRIWRPMKLIWVASHWRGGRVPPTTQCSDKAVLKTFLGQKCNLFQNEERNLPLFLHVGVYEALAGGAKGGTMERLPRMTVLIHYTWAQVPVPGEILNF